MKVKVTSTLSFYFLITLSLLALLFMFVGKASPYMLRSLHELWNVGHVLAFFLWTLLFLKQFGQTAYKRSLSRFFILCLAFVLIIGGSVELLQWLMGREASLHDMTNNLLGSLLALCLYACSKEFLSKSLCISSVFILCIICLGINRYVLIYIADEVNAARQFPVLLDFTTSFERERVQGNADIKVIEHNNSKKLHVRFGTEQYSGFAMQYFPRDWRQYSRLEINIVNPEEETLTLTCRIHDVMHSDGNEEYDDRYNQSFQLEQGLNQISIGLKEVEQAPAHRKMDLGSIGGLGCFTVKLQRPRDIYLLNISLDGESK